MIRFLKVKNLTIATFWLFLLFAASSSLYAESPAVEMQKIEALIKQVSDLKEANFIRNDSTYEVSSALRLLHGKWDANAAEIKTARDFIDKIASVSGTSGKPYLIRFKDGREITSREYLLTELQKLEP